MSLVELLNNSPGPVVVHKPIVIDGDLDDLSVYPIALGDRSIDFRNRQVTIRNCKGWPGLFTMRGGEIKGLTLDFTRNNTLGQDPDTGLPNAVLVASNVETSSHGTLENIRATVTVEGDVAGALIGSHAGRDGALKMMGIRMHLKANNVNGAVVGPYVCHRANELRKISFAGVTLRAEVDTISGLVLGRNTADGTGEKFSLSMDFQFPVAYLKGQLITDEFSQRHANVFGVDPNRDAKMGLMFTSTKPNLKDPLLKTESK